MYRRKLEEPSELQECTTFYEWASYNPLIKEYLIKHVNEGKRTKFGGFLLNRIGLRKGLPDYQLPIPNKSNIGLWIEVKRKSEKNKKQKPEQIEWLVKLRRQGHYATFAFGADEAIKVVTDYLNNLI